MATLRFQESWLTIVLKSTMMIVVVINVALMGSNVTPIWVNCIFDISYVRHFQVNNTTWKGLIADASKKLGLPLTDLPVWRPEQWRLLLSSDQPTKLLSSCRTIQLEQVQFKRTSENRTLQEQQKKVVREKNLYRKY